MSSKISVSEPRPDNGGHPARRPRRPWLTAVKWIAGIVIGLFVVIGLGVGIAVWILTPERLTPMVEKYGSRMIDGEVKAGRVELTYWSTWPRLNLEVDSLYVISHTLRGLTAAEREALPAGADTVLKVDGFSGGVNILKLLRGEIALNDVVITRPAVKLVDVRDGLSNYNIFPPDTTATDTVQKPLSVPDITFRRFEIRGNAPISYTSLPDTTSLAINLQATQLEGEDAPAYKFDMKADASSRIGDLSLENLRVGIGGDVKWNHKKPYAIELVDFVAGVNNVRTITSAKLDFANDLTVESLAFEMPQVALNEIIAIVPPALRGDLEKVDNNLTVKLKAHLLKPYRPVSDKAPTMDLTLSIPQGEVTYDRLKLQALALDVEAHVDGADINRSVVTLKRLFAAGEGVGVDISATATDLLTDPHITGTFKGGVRFDKLPAALTSTYNLDVSGRLVADAAFNLRQSDLTRNSFHKMRLTGDATLADFRLSWAELPLDFYTHETQMKLGTTSSFVRGATAVDSLLTVSLKIDTLAATVQGMELRGRNWRAGAGARNVGQSADTTLVNPIGAVLSMDRLWFRDITMASDGTADTMKVTLRGVKANASVKRYHDMKKVPLLALNASLDRLRYADRYNRLNLRETTLNATAHPQAPRMNKRIRASLDSIRRAYPSLPLDSAYRLAAKRNPSRLRGPMRSDSLTRGTEKLDIDVDSTTANLLKRWRAQGRLKAARGRLLTPFFPLKNRLRNLDLTFNNDSVMLRDTKLISGRSDFLINGSITNLQRGLTSGGRSPLAMELLVKSDTIDVNELTAAAFAGAAFSARLSGDSISAVGILDSDDDEAVSRSISQAVDTTETGPLLLPVNVRAHFDLKADVVKYSNFTFRNMHGEAALQNGALNLRDLSGHTDVGSINLSALYDGLDVNDLSFAMGLKVTDFKVANFIDMMPALDSIMPLLNDVDGIIDAEVAAASKVDSAMNLVIPTLKASVTIHGDSLVLLDAQTFRKIGKWLLFKHKDRNVVDSMTVKLTVHDGVLELYPFIFDIDRYKLGVFGSNDLNLNFKYHVAVLKSPIPFKFGINVSGNPDKMKIRLGGAKVNEKQVSASMVIADTTRINLINQIENVFRRGLRNANRAGRLRIDTSRPANVPVLDDSPADMISATDSLFFINEGLIERPDSLLPPPVTAPVQDKNDKRRRR